MLTRSQRGITLIEVLVTATIVSFGLLGVAAFQIKASLGEQESYQRGQALGVMNDMMERLKTNSGNGGAYVVNGSLGTGDAQPSDCSTLAIGAPRDLCEWSRALKGDSEKSGSANAGGMTAGRGCITLQQAANPADGFCTPAIYRVAVAWQGSHSTRTAADTCGKGAYGADETMRRVIFAQVVVGLPTCSL